MIFYKRNRFRLFVLMALPFFITGFCFKNKPFKIKKAYYQSWIISDNEKGTNIEIKITKVDKNVTFDSIVFRGLKLKAFETRNKNEVTLKSIIPSGRSRIKLDSEPVNLPAQLIYHQDGIRKTCLLKSVKRMKTRIY